VTLRLQPTPEAMAAATCALPSLRAAVDCVTQVLQHGIRVARIELADELQVRAINRFEGTSYAEAPTLFLEFHGSEEEVAAQARETEEVAAAHGALHFAWAAEEAERRRLWHARHRAYEASRRLVPGSKGLTTDACVPLSELAGCLLETQADIAETGSWPPSSGTWATATSTPACSSTPTTRRTSPAPRPSTTGSSAARWPAAGRAAASTAWATARRASCSRSTGRTSWRSCAASSTPFDPDGIFNPGKVADLSALA
jgi:FAD/FMN-containing dehydrogenase